MAHLTTYLDLESLKIRRSGFDFKLNLTSAIGDLANRNILASYVSRLNAMAYDRVTDQDLHRSEVWLSNHRRLAGMIRAVVAGPPPQAHRRGSGRGASC